MATRSLPPVPLIAEHPEVAALKERVRRLEKINAALIDRVERSSDIQGGAFSMFETAITLEAMVRERTTALEDALATLNQLNAQLEAAHQDAEAARVRLRDAIESLNDGFALFDADDHLLMCNRAFLGFWPDLAVIEGDSPDFADMAGKLAEHGRTIGSLIAPDRWVGERVARHRRAAGAHVQALSDGRWLQINELRTSEGGIVSIYTDITSVKAEDARERARELAEQNLALQATLDTLSEGVCLFDAGGQLVAWNNVLARMLAIDGPILDCIGTHPQLVDWCQALGLAARHALDWSAAPRPRQGTECVIGQRTFVIRSTTIAPGGMAFTFDDVTDRIRFQRSLTETAETLERRVEARTGELVEVNRQLVEAKNEAEQANRSKTSFLAAASHDLLQPLNAARLFVSALAERRLALPTRGLVRQTGVALDSVEELLEALFEISRLDAGAIQPEITPIRLDRMLSALRIEFAPAARARELEFDVPETGVWVRSDVRLLRRILQNLVSNALRYTQAGAVGIAVEVAGDQVTITVRDTGPGIPEEKREAIFEEFRRLEGTQKIPGHGLGLAIVRRAGTMLGHAIGVASQLGRGSAFSITVPLADPVHEIVRRPVRGARGVVEPGGSVLIIDNDAQILAGMRALLTNWGMSVITATDPADPAARDAVSRGTGLIIADYHLDGGLTGDRAIAQLRAAAGSQVPALIITADRSEDVKAMLAAAGLPLLTKPVKPAQLRALLRQLEAST